MAEKGVEEQVLAMERLLKNGTPQSRYCSVWKEKRANSCIYDNRRKWRKINQRHFRKKDQNKLVGMLLIF